jgi:hypothetical protein
VQHPALVHAVMSKLPLKLHLTGLVNSDELDGLAGVRWSTRFEGRMISDPGTFREQAHR